MAILRRSLTTLGTLGQLLGDHLMTMGVRINPWGAMMLMEMDDCTISHLEVHCLRQILCEVDLPKASESSRRHWCRSWLFPVATNGCRLGGLEGGGMQLQLWVGV